LYSSRSFFIRLKSTLRFSISCRQRIVGAIFATAAATPSSRHSHSSRVGADICLGRSLALSPG
jgi:hypothetical protein